MVTELAVPLRGSKLARASVCDTLCERREVRATPTQKLYLASHKVNSNFTRITPSLLTLLRYSDEYLSVLKDIKTT